jgi:polyhydroxyalkanoate synthesis regulator phasin
MIDQLKKALTAGVGLALKTWDEVEALGKDIVQKAKLSEKEAASLLQSLRKNYESTQKKLEGRANQLVKGVLKKADVATSEEVKALKREIQALKKQLKSARPAATAKAKAAPKKKAAPRPRAAAKVKPMTKAKME